MHNELYINVVCIQKALKRLSITVQKCTNALYRLAVCIINYNYMEMYIEFLVRF